MYIISQRGLKLVDHGIALVSYIDGRRRTIFKRLLNTLPILNIVSALTAGSSVGALSFDDFHPSFTLLCHASEGLFTSCAIAAVISIMLSTMLILWFETVESLLMRDYFLLWTPVILLDCYASYYIYDIRKAHRRGMQSFILHSWGIGFAHILLLHLICDEPLEAKNVNNRRSEPPEACPRVA